MEKTLKKLTGGEPDDNGDMEAAIKAHEAEIERTKSQAKNALLKSAFIAKAAENNIVDPSRVFKMIDSGDERLSIDLKTGEVDGIGEIVTELIKDAPYLVKAADGTTPPPNAPTSVPAPGSPPPTGLDKPPDKNAKIEAAYKKAEETGGVKAAMEYMKAKRDAEAEAT
jgi:hypothetical protein